MGLVYTNLLPLVKESVRRRFSGRALCLGHPVLHLSADKVGDVFELAGARRPEISDGELSGVSVLRELGFECVMSSDVSDYEGADLRLDLNCDSVPDELRGTFDLVLDHGTLEHVFHVPNAMSNIYSLLREGGRVFHSAPGSNFFDHGFYSFSPTFFYDYYNANSWTLEGICVYQMRRDATSPPFFAEYRQGEFDNLSYGGLGEFMYGTICTATKTAESTCGQPPHQGRYRNLAAWRAEPAGNGVKGLDAQDGSSQRATPSMSEASEPPGTRLIPFGRPDFSAKEIDGVSRVMRSGWVGRGHESIAFEAELAEAVGVDRVLTVNSCTAGLFLSLVVSGVGPGDEVICPSLTWCADANVVLQLGARPVFCDVAGETLNMTAATVAAKLTTRTKAVIVVHFGGLAADVESISATVPDTVTIIEDAAHAFGARYADGTPVGSAGNLTCFSFYANKNLSSGDGGAIVVPDTADAERIGYLRHGGLRADAFDRYRGAEAPREWIVEPGYKMGYSDLLASLGRVQLARQAEFATRRLAIAERYVVGLSGVAPEIAFQAGVLSRGHARHLLVVNLPLDGLRVDRTDLMKMLLARNVGVSVHYPPLHKAAAYASLEPLPVTEMVCSTLMTLPIGASMTDDEATYCADQVAQLWAGFAAPVSGR